MKIKNGTYRLIFVLLFLVMYLADGGMVYGADEVKVDGVTAGAGVKGARLKAAAKGQESPHDTMIRFILGHNDYVKAKNADDTRGMDKARAQVFSCMDLSKLAEELHWKRAVALMEILNRLYLYPVDGEDGSWRLLSQDELKKQGDKSQREQVFFSGQLYEFDQQVQEEDDEVFGLAELYRDVQPKGRIVLGVSADGGWRFTSGTVMGVHELYASVREMDLVDGVESTDKAEVELWLGGMVNRFLPEEMVNQRFLTLEVWQWVSLLGFIFLGIIFDRIIRFGVRWVAVRLIRKQGGKPDKNLLKITVRPAGLLVMALFWLNMVEYLELPDTAFVVIQGGARVFAVLACTLFAWRLTDLVADALASKASKTDNRFDDVLIPMVRTALKILIVIMGFVYGSLSLKFDIEPILGSLAIGGVGFAFAAKDTLENFFGSATVLIDQPFAVGDWIVVGDVEGTVERIGFRSTRVRTFYNSLITVPNANLVRATVDNYGHRKYRRYRTYLGVEYGTPPDKILAFTEGIREIVRTHPFTRKDYFQVWLNDFNKSSLDILVYVFFETPEWTTELRERERFMLDIIRLADALGIGFAFPTQTLHMVDPDRVVSHDPMEAPGGMTDARSQVQGLRAAKGVMKQQRWQEVKPGAYDFNAKGAVGGDVDVDAVEDGEKPTFIEDTTSGA